MRFLTQLPSILKVSFLILLEGIRDSFAIVGSSLRQFPVIIKSEIFTYKTVAISTEEEAMEFADSREEQSIYGYQP